MYKLDADVPPPPEPEPLPAVEAVKPAEVKVKRNRFTEWALNPIREMVRGMQVMGWVWPDGTQSTWNPRTEDDPHYGNQPARPLVFADALPFNDNGPAPAVRPPVPPGWPEPREAPPMPPVAPPKAEAPAAPPRLSELRAACEANAKRGIKTVTIDYVLECLKDGKDQEA